MMKASAKSSTKDNFVLLSFEEAFGPLAYHLFPDGCPSQKQHDKNLQSVWPPPKSRAVVSSKEALAAIKYLCRLAKRHGFSSSEQEALTVAACATLPQIQEMQHQQVPKSSSSSTKSFVVENTPLRDGSSQHFRTLLRSVLPKPDHRVSSFVVLTLVSALPRLDSLGKNCVLQFLTLTTRMGALSAEARQTLSSLYSVSFHWAMEGDVCGDAVRLLHAITRRTHVRVYRAKRLYEFYHQFRGSDQQYNYSPLLLLLQLYARYDPEGCGEYFPQRQRRGGDGKGLLARWFEFPDMVWERHFSDIWHNHQAKAFSSSHQGMDYEDDNRLEHRQATKRQKKASSTVMDTLDQLHDTFEGVHSFSTSFGSSESRTLRASDLLQDDSLTHLMLLSSPPTEDGAARHHSESPQEHNETARLKVCLPFMLQEEWNYRVYSASNWKKAKKEQQQREEESNDEEEDNDHSSLESRIGTDDKKDEELSNDDKTGLDKDCEAFSLAAVSPRRTSRARLLESFSVFATKTDSVLPETESMILDEILKSWDGTDEWGVLLCYDILPYVSSCKCFSEIRNKNLVPLETLFLYGASRVQHAIVSGTLTSLLSQLTTQRTVERKTVKELVQWTDDLLLQGFLVDEQGGNSELLCGAVVEFFRVVCFEVAQHCSIIVLPSTALVYRLLLSRSVVSLDRVCQLLVDYKNSFQKLKEKQIQGQQSQERTGEDGPTSREEVEGLDQ